MPLCYGGGIRNADQAARIIDLGVEKLAVSAAAVVQPELLSEIAAAIGRQSVVAVLDIKKRSGFFAKGYELRTHNARQAHAAEPTEMARRLQNAGAGEIVLNSIDRDGHMQGYDLGLAQRMQAALHVPLTVLGGAGSLEDVGALLDACGAVGAAAGSLFVFKGKYRAVLIHYPSANEKEALCLRAQHRPPSTLDCV